MLRGLEVEYVNVILENPQELFVSLMRKHPENVESMLKRHAFCLYVNRLMSSMVNYNLVYSTDI